jgi:hypothetical protein
MKPAVIIVSCMLLLVGCAHLEVPSKSIYPFRAEFNGSGVINGVDTRISGALYLTSGGSGIVEIYGPGGMASYTVDINRDNLILKDMWGNKTDEMTLPLNDIAGLFAGDVPRGAYFYKKKTACGTKVNYSWGGLCIDDNSLPKEVQVHSNPPLELIFSSQGKNVILKVSHGLDTLRITLMIRQGGRWLSS